MNPLTSAALFLLLVQCQGLLLSRIIGGEIAPEGEFPYVAALKEDTKCGRFVCGGVIISEHWILTAAHCLNKTTHPNPFTVLVGTNNLHQGGTVYKTKDVIAHDHYNSTFRNYDIGLLRTTRRIRFNRQVQPIRLPHKNPILYTTMPVVVAGWGKTKMTGKNRYPSELYYLNSTLYDHDRCKRLFKKVTDNQICAFKTQGQGVCRGDSGSALVHDGVVYGITSYVKVPCGKGVPDIYTNVYKLLDWIKEKSNNELVTRVYNVTEEISETDTLNQMMNSTELDDDTRNNPEIYE